MKRILFGLLILILVPALAAAQGSKPAAAGQKLFLEFVDGGELTITTADKSQLKLGVGIFEGDEVPVGATIATGAGTSAELKLKPNGTIIKLAKSTSFTVKGLASSPKEKNAFALAAGKIRAVASKGAQYEISSKSAVCAVRGTDFSFAVDEGSKAVLMVAKGLVQFDKTDDAGAVLGSIPVGAGQAADAFAASFASFKYSAEQFAEQFNDVGFQKLLETDVPERAPEAAPEPAPAKAAEPQAATVVAAPPAPPAEQAPAEGQKGPATGSATAESGLMKWMREALGFEIGSVTINENTYSKAVIQPNLQLGKAKIGLYLPIIYSSDLFDPEDWYKPSGNNEWDFGYEKIHDGRYLAGAGDLLTDLGLKIKYFEYGQQMVDPFFIKVGNLEDLTLGHGLIMRNYANDTDFPSVRRLGFNLGYDGGAGGFEALTNDLTDNQIFGARVFIRPIPSFKLALGLSGVIDWNPAADTSLNTISDGELKIIGTGLDLDLPIIQSPILGIRAFADGAVTVPYTTEKIGNVDSGLQYQLVYDKDTGKFKNWGAAGGFLGNVLFIDYRLEYRYFTGNFKPSFFDSTYDRMRGQYAAQYLGYLTDTATYDDTPSVMGVYGEGGFKFLNEKLTFTMGYMMPWSLDSDADMDLVRSSDEFHAKLAIKKGLIPFIDVAGSISYDRRGLSQAIADGNFKFLDENTLFGGEILVPVPKTPNLDLALLFQTMPVLDSKGAIKYANASDAAKGIPEMKPSISIETRFHF